MLFDEEKYIYISLDYRPRGLYLMVVQHTASPLLLAFLLWGLVYRHTPSSRRGLPVLLQFYTWGLISVNKGKALGGRVGAKGDC